MKFWKVCYFAIYLFKINILNNFIYFCLKNLNIRNIDQFTYMFLCCYTLYLKRLSLDFMFIHKIYIYILMLIKIGLILSNSSLFLYVPALYSPIKNLWHTSSWQKNNILWPHDVALVDDIAKYCLVVHPRPLICLICPKMK